MGMSEQLCAHLLAGEARQYVEVIDPCACLGLRRAEKADNLALPLIDHDPSGGDQYVTDPDLNLPVGVAQGSEGQEALARLDQYAGDNLSICREGGAY
jgi:hypothetical protein